MSKTNSNSTCYFVCILMGLLAGAFSWWMLSGTISVFPLLILFVLISIATAFFLHEAFCGEKEELSSSTVVSTAATATAAASAAASSLLSSDSESVGEKDTAKPVVETATKPVSTQAPAKTASKAKSSSAKVASKSSRSDKVVSETKASKASAAKTAAPKAASSKSAASKKSATVASKATSAKSSAKSSKAAAVKAPVAKAVKAPTAKTTKAPAAKAGPVRLKKPDGKADDLKLISGVGPKLEKTLNDLGFWHFAQIGKWKKADVAVVDDELRFKGRIERDDWIKQAKALAKGGEAEYIKVFGKKPR